MISSRRSWLLCNRNSNRPPKARTCILTTESRPSSCTTRRFSRNASQSSPKPERFKTRFDGLSRNVICSCPALADLDMTAFVLILASHACRRTFSFPYYKSWRGGTAVKACRRNRTFRASPFHFSTKQPLDIPRRLFVVRQEIVHLEIKNPCIRIPL